VVYYVLTEFLQKGERIMEKTNYETENVRQRNYTPWVITLSIAINLIVAILFFMPKADRFDHWDLTFLPMLNAIFNSFTTVFLLAALYFIRRKNVKLHRRFILAAFATTALFLITYLIYHSLAESTPYGGEGVLRAVYYFILITHVVLAAVIVPLALFTLARGLNMQVEKHRKIARWTMPLWLYVSITGVLVYLMISPYY
jgi:putative membrane protein